MRFGSRLLLNKGRGMLQVIVLGDDDRVGSIDRAAPGKEIEEAAMVGAVEYHDVSTPGKGPDRTERHQISFRARVAEPHALADDSGELSFKPVGRTEDKSLVENRLDGGFDRGVGVTVETCRVLSRQVRIRVSVCVPHPHAPSFDDAQRIGIVVKDDAGVPTR